MKDGDFPLKVSKILDHDVQPLAAWEVGIVRSLGMVLFRAFGGEGGEGDEEHPSALYVLSQDQALALRNSLDEALKELAKPPARRKPRGNKPRD